MDSKREEKNDREREGEEEVEEIMFICMYVCVWLLVVLLLPTGGKRAMLTDGIEIQFTRKFIIVSCNNCSLFIYLVLIDYVCNFRGLNRIEECKKHRNSPIYSSTRSLDRFTGRKYGNWHHQSLLDKKKKKKKKTTHCTGDLFRPFTKGNRSVKLTVSFLLAGS